MPQTEGVVVAVSPKDRGYSLYVEDDSGERRWFRAWSGTCTLARGQRVRINYKVVEKDTGIYFDIVSVEPVGGVEARPRQPSSAVSTEERVSKTAIFKALCSLYAGRKEYDEICALTRKIYEEDLLGIRKRGSPKPSTAGAQSPA